ncbi:GNAT family N-acetyltransferase [Kocuria tytonis]|uniref:N-acetyltransferase n=1 Tax=Kocuria tytonis TaxID=2054280 RepID=A0A495ABM0_9MICC|nr:GNAT family protein [Kocuria tytonis]RKQ36874.1 N-acetyltransferase [Kocuria tytonis]
MNTAGEWPVTVQWGQLVLRPLAMGDRGEWDRVRYRNREWLEPWEASNPEQAGTAPSYRGFVRLMRQQARAGQSLPWLITETDGTGRHQDLVGQLTVSSITLGSFRSATLGYWVDGSQAGRGIAPMAVAMATDYCFQHLRLHRMEINIRPENAKSLRVVEKLGFRDEGLRERFLHIAGSWADHRSFALTAEEVPEGLVRRFTGSEAGIEVRRAAR